MTAEQAERRATELLEEHDQEVACRGEANVGMSRVRHALAYATLALSIRHGNEHAA